MFVWSNIIILIPLTIVLLISFYIASNKEEVMSKVKYKLKMIKIEYRYHKMMLTSDKVWKKYKTKHLFSMIFRRCTKETCRGKRAYLKHSNCSYVDELSNYNYCCKECHEEIDATYQEWWDEYNSGRY